MLRSVIMVLAMPWACAQLEFDPPTEPLHFLESDDFFHAGRLFTPFSCGDPNDATGQLAVVCPAERPADVYLSCDAFGCHGGYEFTPESAAARHLKGSEGPSCFACHDDKWNDEKDEEDD